MILFVYNIWWVTPNQAAVWMELYEFQRTNGKCIIIFWYVRDEESLRAIRSLDWMFFSVCCLPWLWLDWSSLWWIIQEVYAICQRRTRTCCKSQKSQDLRGGNAHMDSECQKLNQQVLHLLSVCPNRVRRYLLVSFLWYE